MAWSSRMCGAGRVGTRLVEAEVGAPAVLHRASPLRHGAPARRSCGRACGHSATPMLQVSVNGAESRPQGCATAFSTRRASVSAAAASACAPASRTGRRPRARSRRPAQAALDALGHGRSTSSPMSWPRLSLICRKRSRSTSSSAKPSPAAARMRTAASSTRSARRRRLGSPVSASVRSAPRCAGRPPAAASGRGSCTRGRPAGRAATAGGSRVEHLARVQRICSVLLSSAASWMALQPALVGVSGSETLRRIQSCTCRVVAGLEQVSGMPHICAKRRLNERMRPARSVTRMPSAVDSSVARSSATRLRARRSACCSALRSTQRHQHAEAAAGSPSVPGKGWIERSTGSSLAVGGRSTVSEASRPAAGAGRPTRPCPRAWPAAGGRRTQQARHRPAQQLAGRVVGQPPRGGGVQCHHPGGQRQRRRAGPPGAAGAGRVVATDAAGRRRRARVMPAPPASALVGRRWCRASK
jgi:hypothetical protein